MMTNDKDSAVLAPCPFCGKQCAQLIIDQGDKWAHYEPSCLEVRTSYNVSDDAPWRANAIAAWNTRQPTQSDALTIACAALARIEAATRNEVRAGDKGYISRYGINGIARAALQEQSK